MNFPVSLAFIVLHATLSEKLKTALKALRSLHLVLQKGQVLHISF